MNKALSAAALVMAQVVSFTTPAQAAEGQFYLAPGVQWMNYDNTLNLDDATGFTWGVGYDFTDRFSAELSGMDIDPTPIGAAEIDVDHYRGDFYYSLTAPRRVTPFLTTGLGNMNFNGDHETVWDVGAGLNVKLGDRWSWRTAVRNFQFFGRDMEDGDYGFDTALVYRFGLPRRAPVVAAATPAPAAPVVADADGDGVPDSLDACPDTPRAYAVDERGCPIPLEEVARLDLKVNFDFDRAEVKPEYLPEIRRVVEFMNQYPEVIVELEGHTDSTGGDKYNQGLSQRRVDAVREVLVGQMGMQASRITAVGYGEARPLTSNATPEGRAENRRVVSVMVKTLQRFQPR